MTQSIFEQHDILDRLFDELKRSYQEGATAGYEQLLTVAPALTAEEYELVIERFTGYMRNQELLAIKEQEKELREQIPFVPESISSGLLSLEQQFFRSFSRFLVERDRKIARAASAAMDEVRSGRTTLEEEIKGRSAAYEERIAALEAALALKEEQLTAAMAEAEQARAGQRACAADLDRLTLEDEGLELLRALTMENGLAALQGLPYNRTLNSCLSSVFELMEGLDDSHRQIIYKLLYKVENLAAVARSLGYNLKDQCRTLTDADGARHALATADAAWEAAGLTARAAGRDSGLSGSALDEAVNKAALAAREAAFAAALASRGSSAMPLPPLSAPAAAPSAAAAPAAESAADSVASGAGAAHSDAAAAAPAASGIAPADPGVAQLSEQEAALAALKERYKNIEQLGADESYTGEDDDDGPGLSPETASALRTVAAASAAPGGVNTPASMAELLAAASRMSTPAQSVAAVAGHALEQAATVAGVPASNAGAAAGAAGAGATGGAVGAAGEGAAQAAAVAAPVLGEVALTAIQQRTVDALVPVAASVLEGRTLSSLTSFDIEKAVEKARDAGIVDQYQTSAARRLIIKLLFTGPDKVRLADFSGNNDDFIDSLPDDSAKVFARTVLSWAEPGTVTSPLAGSTSALPPGSPLNSVLEALSGATGAGSAGGTAAAAAASAATAGVASATGVKESPVELLNSSSPKALPRDEGTLVREISSEKGNVDIAAFAEASARIASLAPLLNEAGRELRQVQKELEADLDKNLKDGASRFGADSSASGGAESSDSSVSDEGGSSATVEIASVAKDVLKVASELQRSGDRSRSDRKFSIFDSSAPSDKTGTTVFGVGNDSADSIRAEAMASAQERSASEDDLDDDDDLEDFIGGNIREADSSDAGIPELLSSVKGTSSARGADASAAHSSAGSQTQGSGNASGAPGAGAAASSGVSGATAGPLSLQSRTQTTPLGTTNIIRTSTLADEIASRKAAISAAEHSRDSLTAADLENTFRSKDIKTAIAASASVPAGGDRRPGEEVSQYDVAFAAAAAARNARQDNEGSTIVVSTPQPSADSDAVSGAAILGAGQGASAAAASGAVVGATAAGAGAALVPDEKLFRIRNGLNEDNRRRFELLCQIIDKKLKERIEQLRSLLSSSASGGPESEVKLKDIEFFYKSCISSLDAQGLLSDDLKAALFEKMDYDIKTCSDGMATGAGAPRQPYIQSSDQSAATVLNQDSSELSGSTAGAQSNDTRGAPSTANSGASPDGFPSKEQLTGAAAQQSQNAAVAQSQGAAAQGQVVDAGQGPGAAAQGSEDQDEPAHSGSATAEHAAAGTDGDASIQPEIMTVDTEQSEDRKLNMSPAPHFSLVASNEAAPGESNTLTAADDHKDSKSASLNWSEDSAQGDDSELSLAARDDSDDSRPQLEPVSASEHADSSAAENSGAEGATDKLSGVTFSSLDGFEQGEKYAWKGDEAEQQTSAQQAAPQAASQMAAAETDAGSAAADGAAPAEQGEALPDEVVAAAAVPGDVAVDEKTAQAEAHSDAAHAEMVRRLGQGIGSDEQGNAESGAHSGSNALSGEHSTQGIPAEPQFQETVEITPAPEGCHDGNYSLESVQMSSGSTLGGAPGNTVSHGGALSGGNSSSDATGRTGPGKVTGGGSAAADMSSRIRPGSQGVITSDDGVLPITPASAYKSPEEEKASEPPESYSNSDNSAFGFGDGLCSVYGYPSQASFVFHEGVSEPGEDDDSMEADDSMEDVLQGQASQGNDQSNDSSNKSES
ncbi:MULTISPECIES: hypothetical protein [unclassified Anaerobiospirillum]|uniref:hypothetical protein n=1 Tax=unclassified Anaerobiospirillum TaxID=2647410 RepID=UPI001FF2AB65|nr:MULTISPECIES: hypothetical protein [unclassified Anaerobiospirillum]MCK0535857.1 hypothetical protein [Anaerobiospirillum sp. NML120511]MCK0541026.1 hypothetical protein [Anaerobiospirillum sp. NML02-A-032]